MPFNVATIKTKAVSAKNATSERVQNTRDKYSSQPMSKTKFVDQGYVPDTRKQPPPPPPPARSLRPAFPNRGSAEGEQQQEQQYTGTSNLSHSGSEDTSAPPVVAYGTRPGALGKPMPPPMPSRSVSAASSRSPVRGQGQAETAPSPDEDEPSLSASAIRARWQAQAAANTNTSGSTLAPTLSARNSFAAAGAPPPAVGLRPSSALSGDSNDNGGGDDDAPPPSASAIRARWQAQSQSNVGVDKPAVPTPLAAAARNRNSVFGTGAKSPAPPPPIAPKAAINLKPHTSSAHPYTMNNSSPAVDKELKIDWSNLSPADKQAFFAWLDEFFAMFTSRMTRTEANSGSQRSGMGDGVTHGGLDENEEEEVEAVERVEQPKPPPVSTTIATATPGSGPPPMIKSWSKPKLEATPAPAPVDDSSTATTLQMSYPPPSQHGSAALDLAHFFSPSTSWDHLPSSSDRTWYASPNPVPPPLIPITHKLYKLAMGWRGDAQHVQLGALFADLSGFWARVDFARSDPARREDVVRKAWTTPIPKAIRDKEYLEGCAASYGAVIADYAEGFAERREVCARGECWDVADQAIKHATEVYADQPPIPSLGRTHGHLIFYGRALPSSSSSSSAAASEGRWRGADDRVRRGDVIEWRSVRIGFAPGSGPGRGAYAILGDPEHTAVITSDSEPLPLPHSNPNANSNDEDEDVPLAPHLLGYISVVEQSQGVPVKRASYDLAQLFEGEVWIYRPVGMEMYLGFGELGVEPPGGAVSAF